MDNISQQPADEARYSAGIGFLVIPKDVERSKYILDCYKNGWVTIYIENEGLRERVNCDLNVFNFLYFPDDYRKTGTSVVWVSDPLKGNLYITSVLSTADNYEPGSENGFRLIRKFEDNFVEISGNSKQKSLNLVIHGDTSSSLDIAVIDLEKKSKLNVTVNGDILTRANGSTQFINHKNFGVQVENEDDEEIQSSFNVNESSIFSRTYRAIVDGYERFEVRVGKKGEKSRTKVSQIIVLPESITTRSKKFSINQGVEPMVLGNALKELLDDFILEVSKIQVITPMGITPIYNKPQILALQMKTKKILSKFGFLD